MRPPQAGAVIVRVYTAWIGVGKRSAPSRKNGRFSGKNNANRSFAEICAVSDSTCEKSGLTVKSTALSAFGVYFTSSPACGFTGSDTSPEPTSSRRCDPSLALTYGATTRWPPLGRRSRPVKEFDRQRKQLLPRGNFAEKN